MSDFSITPGNVVPDSDAKVADGIYGEAISAGDWVYRDSADENKWKKADADAEASAAVRGMASVSGASGVEGKVVTSGHVTTGTVTGAASGLAAFVSTTAGKACLESDLGSGKFTSLCGIWTANNKIKVAPVVSAAAKP